MGRNDKLEKYGVIRAAHQEIQLLLNSYMQDFPVRASELNDLLPDIAMRSGRSLDEPESTLFTRRSIRFPIKKAITVSFPLVLDVSKVGEYPALAKAGGGFVWDAVLEYRVWCHPERGAADDADGSDYYYAFKSYEEADAFSRTHDGTEEPLALVLQREYIDEPEPGIYVHVREERVTEWPVVFLSRPQRDARTIPDFLAGDAPANRLDILRGLAPRITRVI